MNAAIQKLAAATRSEYEFAVIEGVHGLKIPIFRVSLDYLLAKHPGILSEKRFAQLHALLSGAEPPAAENALQGVVDYLQEFLQVAIDVVSSGCPELAGRIHIERPLDAQGQPLEAHFTVEELGAEFAGLLAAILRLSLPRSVTARQAAAGG